MSDSASVAAAGFSMVYSLISLALCIVVIVAWWKIFVKAGKPGWASIIPLYNTYCMFQISFGNGWLFLLCLVPCVNIVMIIIMYVKLAKAFGKSGGFAVGLIFLSFIFLPMLGFGDADYIGPA